MTVVLNLQIAEKIQHKVAGLVGQPISVVDPSGTVLATNQIGVEEVLVVTQQPTSISFNYAGQPAGFIVTSPALGSAEELEPLIRSIAELILHQQLLIDQMPRVEERTDKFIYDLLQDDTLDPTSVSTEAAIHDLDLTRPRVAVLVAIDDPVLTTIMRTPSSDRDTRISRYKSGIARALSSFYTTSRDNIVTYIGENKFVILKDIQGGSSELEDSLAGFKKSIPTLYDIVHAEVKLPAIIGVGNYHHGRGGLAHSFREASSAIELGRQRWDGNSIYHIDDFGVVAPLLSGVDQDNIYFSRDLLDKIDTNSEVLVTLEAFFDLDMALTATANRLGIHRNTLVYRLDRINDALGLDPRVFEDAVQIKLAMLYGKFMEDDYAYRA